MATSPRIDELRKKFDENPRRYFAPLANEYRKVGDFDQAIFICQEYLPQQPGHMSGHIVFGQALFEAKRLPEAKTVFETALTLDPENLIALRHLADISRGLGDLAAAKTWYERVLQADPRNEEVVGIMATMGGGAAPAAAAPPTPAAVKPVPTVPETPAAKATSAAGSASAATMDLSIAQVQQMVKERKAAQAAQAAPTQPVPSTLDDAMTIEQLPVPTGPALEGLEPTSHSGPIDAPTGSILDAPPSPEPATIQTASILDPQPTAETYDIPAGGMLGLEPTAVGAPPPEPEPVAAPPNLDELAIDDFAPPAAAAAAPAPAAPPALDLPPDIGLIELDTVDLGAPATASAGATPTIPESAPIDGGHDGLMDLEIDIPSSPATPASPKPTLDAVPTMVIEAVKDTAPAVIDVIQEVVPAVVEAAKEAMPAIVDAAITAPTKIMEAIRAEPPAPPAKKKPDSDVGPTQIIDVASVMAAKAARTPPAEPPKAAESSAPPPAQEKAVPAFVTETMAQLYLEQGHRDQAIDIYRQLVAAKPNDAELRKRLQAIEQAPTPPAAPVAAPAPAAPAPAPMVPAAPAPRFTHAGPRARDVLRELFGIDASITRAHGNGAPADGQVSAGEAGSIDLLFAAQAATEDLDQLAAAFDGGYVAARGTVDEVFGGG